MRGPFVSFVLTSVIAAAIVTAPSARFLRVSPLSSALSAYQQTPPVFRGGTDLVELDVSVLDKHRKPVRGLKASDFTVLEDGKSQRIDAVSEVAIPEADTPPPVWARTVPPDVLTNEIGDKRLFAIIVDAPILNPPVTSAMPAGILSRRPDPPLVDAITSLVHGIIDRLGPGDVAALMGTACFLSFTDDHKALYAAIDAVRPERPGCPPLPAGADRHYANPAEMRPPHLLIYDMTEYLAAVPQRRKAIIYIGQGWAMVGGRQNHVYDDMANTFFMAQQANVNIYTINPYDLGTGASLRSMRTLQLDSLRDLAYNTGGFPIIDPLKEEEGLTQLFAENHSYYMVGYHTTHPEMDGKYRKIDVKVAGHSGVLVRTRPMLYRPKLDQPAAAAPAAKPSGDLAPKMGGLLPSLDVRFDASVLPFADGFTPRTSFAIVTELTEPVQPGATHVVQKLDVRVVLYNTDGDTVIDRTENVSLDQPPSSVNSVRYGVLSRIQAPPGRYTLRIVAHNTDTDKTGNVQMEIFAPDFVREAVSLSGVAIVSATAAASPVFGTLDNLLPVTPTAARTFSTVDRVAAFVRAYEGGTDPVVPVVVTSRLLDATGKPVFDATETLTPDRFTARAADYRLDLPIDKLQAGEYLLTMEASMGARRTPRRDVRFVIR